MITRRATLSAGLAAMAGMRATRAAELSGVSATTLKIGNTCPYSGPAKAYGVLGYTAAAFFKSVNDHGGIAKHQVDFISLDDSYSPKHTVEAVRRLIEQDQVDFLFEMLGTPTDNNRPWS